MAYQNQRLGKCRKQCPATLSLFFWGGGGRVGLKQFFADLWFLAFAFHLLDMTLF